MNFVRCFSTPPPARFQEIIVHFVGDDLVFPIAQFASRVEMFEFQSGDFRGGLAMFLEIDCFPAGPRQGVDQAGEALGVATQFVLKLARAEMPKGAEEMSDGHLSAASLNLPAS